MSFLRIETEIYACEVEELVRWKLENGSKLARCGVRWNGRAYLIPESLKPGNLSYVWYRGIFRDLGHEECVEDITITTFARLSGLAVTTYSAGTPSGNEHKEAQELTDHLGVPHVLVDFS